MYGGGGRGHFQSALKKFSARKGVNNIKEKWKVVASKETSLSKFYSRSTAIRAVKV